MKLEDGAARSCLRTSSINEVIPGCGGRLAGGDLHRGPGTADPFLEPWRGTPHGASGARRGGTCPRRCGAGLRLAGQQVEWRALSGDDDPQPAAAAALQRFLSAQKWALRGGEDSHAADT